MFDFQKGRATPQLGPMAYKTYTIRPRYRKATCAEIECPHWRDGWTFSVEMLEADPQLNYIARHSNKRFTERTHEGKKYLVFSPGQACFAAGSHRISIDEQPRLWVGRGDWRTWDPRTVLPRDAREFSRADDWVDDFANHQDKLNTAYERG